VPCRGSIITAKFKTKAEEPQISRFFSKLLEHFHDAWLASDRDPDQHPIGAPSSYVSGD
jgi:hypothetical protein